MATRIVDLGAVVGPQGPQGPEGAAGASAKINGVNTLTIVAGEGVDVSQNGNTLTISVESGGAAFGVDSVMAETLYLPVAVFVPRSGEQNVFAKVTIDPVNKRITFNASFCPSVSSNYGSSVAAYATVKAPPGTKFISYPHEVATIGTQGSHGGSTIDVDINGSLYAPYNAPNGTHNLVFSGSVRFDWV